MFNHVHISSKSYSFSQTPDPSFVSACHQKNIVLTLFIQDINTFTFDQNTALMQGCTSELPPRSGTTAAAAPTTSTNDATIHTSTRGDAYVVLAINNIDVTEIVSLAS
jgi:hypothetical protein